MKLTTISAREQDAEVIAHACKEIAHINVHDYEEVKREEGTQNLKEFVPVLAKITDAFAHIKLVDIESIPQSQRSEISRELHNAQNLFFHIHNANFGQLADRNDLRNRVGQTYYDIRKNMAWVMAFVRPDVGESQREMRTKLREMDAMLSQSEVKGEQIDNVLRAAQEQAADRGVTDYATFFDKVARAYAKSKWCWLAATILVAGVAASFGWYQLVGIESTPGDDAQQGNNVPQAIQHVASRLFVFGVLSYLLVWTGRTYRAEAHNHVINKHRCEALKTFKLFRESAKDDATRDAVLTQATQCIFAHRPSGFAQHDDAVPSTQTLELTRNIAGGGDR